MYPFLENPNRDFHVREIARIKKKNHMTVRSRLNNLKESGYITKNKGHIYPVFKANNESRKFKNIKFFYNLEKLRKSEIIEKLNESFDFPTVILFGSFLNATDTIKSDIDICVITDIKRNFDTSSFTKTTKRPISLHIFSEKDWKDLRKNNPHLLNNILNGLTLSGSVEL